MNERSLAHIEKIEWIKSIEGADNIELIGVLGWTVIAKKNEFKVNDLCVFFEIDSKLPEREWSEFMRPKHFKIKTMKLGKFGVFSQGLALPISAFKEEMHLVVADGHLIKQSYVVLHNSESSVKNIGDDLTNYLKVTYSSQEDIQRKTNKIDPEEKFRRMAKRNSKLFKNKFIRKIMRYKFGKNIMFLFFGRKVDIPKQFPSWIVKTDETRIENAPFYLKSENKWIKTEKLDGTSCTYAVCRQSNKKYEFIVCSRNVRQMDRTQETYHESNIYWELADKYNIEKILTTYAKENNYKTIVLQGEGVGFVQGNPYKFDDNKLFIFNLIVDGDRLGTLEMAEFCKKHSLLNVPIIDTEYTLPKTMEEIKLEADGYSIINTNVKREGFVYRSYDGKQSFKNVSREYLLKHS